VQVALCCAHTVHDGSNAFVGLNISRERDNGKTLRYQGPEVLIEIFLATTDPDHSGAGISSHARYGCAEAAARSAGYNHDSTVKLE
jgi:hypothetical protein